MAERFHELSAKHIEFIHDQAMFFVGTADLDGYVNVSPKGMDSLRIVNSKRVIWLNLTGSGNETAAHVLSQNRMTIMFCSFSKQPLILRLYGEATVIHAKDSSWDALIGSFPAFTGARQIFDLRLSLVQTSCGFGVPMYQLKGQRPTLDKWAGKQGKQGIEAYWQHKNTLSLNGKETGMLKTTESGGA